MESDAKRLTDLISKLLIEEKRTQHKAKMSGKVVLLSGDDSDVTIYVSAEQRMSIQSLLMEFYRIMHCDNPLIKFSSVSQQFMRKFDIRSLEFLTTQRFDEIVCDLLGAINKYSDRSYDDDKDVFAGLQIREFRRMTYATPRAPKAPENIVTYLIGKIG
jgi:hypothetical protein